MKTNDEKNPQLKGLAIGCLIVVLICATPMTLIAWKFGKANHDANHARDEFTRTVNPDELRAWVMVQLRKHPQGGEGFISLNDWPDTFPHFQASRFYVFLHTSRDGQRPETPIGAVLAWSFYNQDLIVDVRLNPDGTPADIKDRPHQWAKGIFVSRSSKQ